MTTLWEKIIKNTFLQLNFIFTVYEVKYMVNLIYLPFLIINSHFNSS